MLSVFATSSNGVNTGQLTVDLLFLVVTIVAWWKIFTKAGEPGWKAIIPIYDVFVLYKIAGKPWYWVLLSLIPIANIYFVGYMSVGLGKAFGKSTTWSLILVFLLNVIGFCILAFGKSKYVSTTVGDFPSSPANNSNSLQPPTGLPA